jgi:hypothetical protein
MSHYAILKDLYAEMNRKYYSGDAGNKALKERVDAVCAAIELIESVELDSSSGDGNGNFTLMGSVSVAFWVALQDGSKAKYGKPRYMRGTLLDTNDWRAIKEREYADPFFGLE